VDLFTNVALGFSVALTPTNLLFCFLGSLVGTLVGVLPGLGPVGAIAFLLSLTFKMEPATAIIMLAGIYYGAMYGGSTTSILVNIPGETASVVTCLDGYRMARQGRAGAALGISAFGSFIAGTFGVIGLMFLAPMLGRAALRFGPPEYFALTLTGLTLVAYLTQGSMLKALIMTTLGLLAGSVGDILGRRKVMLFSYAWFSIGMGITALTTGTTLFGLMRFVTGLGVGALVATTGALVAEYAPKGKKNLCNAIVYSGVPLGSLLAAGLAILLLPLIGWRGMFLIGALPLITLFPLAYFRMPESVAWLASRGRMEEARAISQRTGVEISEASPAAMVQPRPAAEGKAAAGGPSSRSSSACSSSAVWHTGLTSASTGSGGRVGRS